MKKNTGNNIKLGIFVSLGLAMFIAGIYFIGERQQLFRNTFHISGIFRDVAGLQAGSNVRFSGINVGTVEKISIVSDTSVRVEILIDESARKFIRKSAVASIGSDGLMGNKILVIYPGIGEKGEIENNDVLETSLPMNIDEIMVSFKRIMENTSDITDDLSKITNNIQSGKGTIGKLLMDQTLAQNIDSSMVNLKEGSQEFKLLMDSAKKTFAQNFDSTFVNLKEGSAGFKVLMDKAKTSWLLWGL